MSHSIQDSRHTNRLHGSNKDFPLVLHFLSDRFFDVPPNSNPSYYMPISL